MTAVFAKKVDEIDASIFSGDVLYNDGARKLLKENVERWVRAIDEYERQEAESIFVGSLEELAAMFDEMALDYKKDAERPDISIRDRSKAYLTQTTWERAAAIVRKVVITGEKK